MSSYTIQLRKVCDLYGREEVESWFKDYEISDYLLPEQQEQLEEYSNIWSKNKLAKKIVDNYYMREIGFETPALFRHYAKIEMEQIMEEMLPLIYTTALEYDPLINVNYTEEFQRTASQEGTSNSSSNNGASALNIISDTPQGQIAKADILQGKYASGTTASENEVNISDETEQNQSSEEAYTKTFKGNQGISATYQAMIKQFRENIVACDKMIIEKLNDLFFRIIILTKEIKKCLI